MHVEDSDEMRMSTGGGSGRYFIVAVSLLVCVSVVLGAITLPKGNTVLHFYKITNSCRYVEQYVRHQVKLAWDHDPSITAALLRLLYSDCFVSGCDASILLDGEWSEKTAPQNLGLGAFVLIDKIKKVVEFYWPGVVSCADILNLATRDAVALAGAPSYPVFTGRRDGYTSSAKSVDLPSPDITWQQALAYFKSKGLDELDLVTLLGAHTVGSAHCRYIWDRLYNFTGTRKPDPNMKSSLVKELKKQCPPRRTGRGDPTVFLNQQSGKSYKFNNYYFSQLLEKEAILQVDQQLLFGGDTKLIAQDFARSDGFEDFRKSFALSMARMGNLGVLTGKKGEIRRNCRRTNKDNAHLK